MVHLCSRGPRLRNKSVTYRPRENRSPPTELVLGKAEDASFHVALVDVDAGGDGTLFQAQAKWAAHLGVPAMVAQVPTESDHVALFARHVALLLHQTSYSQLLLDVELNSAGWAKWNTVRSLCGHSKKLFLALRVLLRTLIYPMLKLTGGWRSL